MSQFLEGLHLYALATLKYVHFASVVFLFCFFSKPRRCLCSSAVENFAFQKQRTQFFFLFFSSVCSSLGAGSSTCGESGPTDACCSAFCLQTLEDCLVQTEFVWFFEEERSCSGESERLRLFGTSPGSEASSTPAWHQTHSSTLRPLFCSVASWSRSSPSWTQCTTTEKHTILIR